MGKIGVSPAAHKSNTQYIRSAPPPPGTVALPHWCRIELNGVEIYQSKSRRDSELPDECYSGSRRPVPCVIKETKILHCLHE